MLRKIDGIWSSMAPAGEHGAESGSSGGEAAASDSGESSSEGEGTGDSGGGDSDGAAADSGAQDGDDFGGDFDFDQFLEYDPFKQDPSPAPEKKEEKSGKEEGAKADKDGEKSTGDGTGVGEGKKAESGDKSELELLKEQIAADREELRKLKEQNKPAAEEGKKAPQTDEEKAKARHEAVMKSLPPYKFNIPKDVMEKLGSDNPADIQAGMSDFASGVAQVTHYNVLAQMEDRFEKLRDELLKESVSTLKETTKAEESAKKERDTIANDFYGKYPELDKPELRLFIQAQARQLAEEYGVNGWNEKFRDALGERVKKVLNLGGNQGPQPNEDAKGEEERGQKKPGVRFAAGGGTGRQTKGGDDVTGDIADTLFT